MNEGIRPPVSLFDGTARPTSDRNIIKLDADAAATAPLRERFRTVGILALDTSPSRPFDFLEVTRHTASITALAARREAEYEQRLTQNPAQAVDEILEGLQTRFQVQSQSSEAVEVADPQGFAHEVMLVRGDLRFRQEVWRDQLDAEMARRLRAEQEVDEPQVAQELFVESTEQEREERQKTGLHFISISKDEITVLMHAFSIEMDQQMLSAQLQEFAAQPSSYGIGNIDGLETRVEGVSVSIWHDNRSGRKQPYDFRIHFSPEAQAKSAMAPLLPPFAP